MDNPPAALKIEVVPASLEQKIVVSNLLELYMHDFCDYLHLELRSDGRFGYAGLESYWADPGRYPFLIYANDNPAGVVLVTENAEQSGGVRAFDMAEFFIVRAFRRRSIGAQVARDVFRRFPGTWKVRVMHVNQGALAFWGAAIAGFAPDAVHSDWTDEAGKAWRSFTFDSRPSD